MAKHQDEGYYLVCPDFEQGSVMLTNDVMTRCLAYLLRHIYEITTLPPGVQLEIIPLRWHHFGEPYPSLAIPAGHDSHGMRFVNGSMMDMMQLAFNFADELTKYIKTLGLEKLIELSASETWEWSEVLGAHEV